jgi:hypothetical protein
MTWRFTILGFALGVIFSAALYLEYVDISADEVTGSNSWYGRALSRSIAWGNRVSQLGGPGRFCRLGTTVQQNAALMLAFDEYGEDNCFLEMHLARASYEPSLGRVSAIYRCEVGEYTGELQVGFLPPNMFQRETPDCVFSMAYTRDNIPLGEITGFMSR